MIEATAPELERLRDAVRALMTHPQGRGHLWRLAEMAEGLAVHRKPDRPIKRQVSQQP